MSRTSLFLAASFLVLAACQPAAEPSDDLVAETPPTVVEEVVVEAVEADSVADEHSDHNEDHNEDHDEHDEHDHAEDHAEDDEEHDHAGGEAHVHGLSDLAISIDAATVSVSLEGALANFDLDESLRTLDDATPYTDGIVDLVGGECTRETSDVSIRAIGDHGNLTVDLVYSCAAIDGLSAINVTAFSAFEGFEEVNAVILTETGQTASTLTVSNTRLDLR
jgi:hypothetical protein